jgi:long-chain acyl-CoA synthetase
MSIDKGGSQLNIANGIREFAVASPHAVAVIDGDRSITYLELYRRACQWANLLVDAGLNPGDPVGILLGNRLEYPELAAGCAMAGLPMVPINPRQTADENSYILEHSEAKALIYDVALFASLPKVLPQHIWAIGDGEVHRNYESEIAQASSVDPKIFVNEQDPFCIAYTSGTTGKPKGVLISHRSRCLTFLVTALEWGLGPGRRTIAVAPMYHGAGFAFAYTAVFTGGSIVMQRKFDPEETLNMISKYKVQSIFLVPTHAQMMRALGDETVKSKDVSSLDTLYFNAAALPVVLKEWVISTFPGVDVHEMYGSTEASIVTNLRPVDALRKAGSVGVPWFMTEVKILNDDGTPTADGEHGELFSKSPFLMNGYLKDAAATQACTTPDGFLTCGDIVIRDSEGYISIVDRKKDLIISGGSNIYPREIEEVLAKHKLVAECAVIGLPDETWGERVLAVVVPTQGDQVASIELESFARERLAGYKVPSEFVFMDALPRNASGKVLKKDLRLQFLHQN